MIAENHWPYKYESVKQGKMNITHRNIKKLIETDIMNKSKCLYHELHIIFFGYLKGRKNCVPSLQLAFPMANNYGQETAHY